jgi:hypothetical protein
MTKTLLWVENPMLASAALQSGQVVPGALLVPEKKAVTLFRLVPNVFDHVTLA